MQNPLIQIVEQAQLAKLTDGKVTPEFSAGDTLKVNVKVSEGNRDRIQAYEGVCVARGGTGLNSSFTVRKMSYGEGVERVFPLYSNRIDSIEVIRKGKVRRAKLYYLRDRQGKSARISERTTGRDTANIPNKKNRAWPKPPNNCFQAQTAYSKTRPLAGFLMHRFQGRDHDQTAKLRVVPAVADRVRRHLDADRLSRQPQPPAIHKYTTGMPA